MILRTLVLGALVVAAACAKSEPLSPMAVDGPLFQGVPADGNGNKIVTPIDLQFPAFTTCADGTTLDVHAVGWFQDRPMGFQGILSAYFEYTFSNAAGETYVWHQVAVGHFHFDESGDLIVAFAGRTLDNVGRMVINLTTGEVVSVSGRGAVGEDIACAALT